MERSAEQGLRSRPLVDTIRDTLAWHETRPAERKAELRSGLTPEQETRLLAAWHAKKTG
jgi:2'-hydroxyisoflavone reductase